MEEVKGTMVEKVMAVMVVGLGFMLEAFLRVDTMVTDILGIVIIIPGVAAVVSHLGVACLGHQCRFTCPPVVPRALFRTSMLSWPMSASM